MRICQSKLGLPIDRNCIDRSHRLGRMTGETSQKPRAVIVKLTSYAPRNDIFMVKRKLKGSKIVVTENLTKRRSELLTKARTAPNVAATWTTDGRIICLLASGRKVTVTTEQQLRGLYAPRNDIFMVKRKLKGSKIVVTENLTKRRSELLTKARTAPNVAATWTTDGRIICLLASGRKVTVTTEQQLRGLYEC